MFAELEEIAFLDPSELEAYLQDEIAATRSPLYATTIKHFAE